MATGKVTLDRLCTIEGIRPLRESFIEAIDAGAGLTVDASGVEHIDISVLQLIVSARKECTARHAAFTLVSGSALSQLAARAGLRLDTASG